jgi:hypothetical protein
MIVRVPIHGKRRATLRFGGVMGETAASSPVGYAYNPDDPGGSLYWINTRVPCGGLRTFWYGVTFEGSIIIVRCTVWP